MQSPIIITGGGQRLGLAAALRLAELEHSVIITYRNSTQYLSQLQEAGVECIQADFSTVAAIEGFVAEVKSRFSEVRALIHNASDWIPEADAVRPDELFDRMMFIHAKVPYLLNYSFSELLKAYADTAGQPADVIHMTDYIIEKGSRKHVAYAASKAALNSLTKSFATKLAPDVKVNEIAPALLMFNDEDGTEYRAKALKKSLMQCAPGEQEGVRAIEYLLNSQYVTGRVLHLDGGRHLV